MAPLEEIKVLLRRIYGAGSGDRAFQRIVPKLERFPVRERRKHHFFSQSDMVLITYGDTLQRPGERPLATFYEFASRYLKDSITAVHFLPFFPYSSDDGFSVMDFHAVDPTLGDWADVARMGKDFELMFDFVINHFSAKGQWFRNYLDQRPGFEDFPIETDPGADLSLVTRPRALPLLTPFTRSDGQSVHLWTTFSEDQIDFNYKSLNVLATMVETLLFYVEKGCDLLRLDAIAYLWKEIGTTCIHLAQTHDMVKLFRKILDIIAPDVTIITETNVPHIENISYFGNGRDEAQMVYNFTLPPLLLHSFVTADATDLSQWAESLHLESAHTTFFNFTASHDGIGVRPLEGILPPAAVEQLIRVVSANGGRVSYKRNPDGTDSPYELNITYVDAILAGADSYQAEKFLASQSIQYALPGVPATYIHSLLGSRNWTAGVAQTGRSRTINREKLNVDALQVELNDSHSFRSTIFYPYLKMIRVRKNQPAFHPNAGFKVMDTDPGVFAIERFTEEQTIYALTNVTSGSIVLSLSDQGITAPLTDLFSGTTVDPRHIVLAPYQYFWLEGDD